MTDPTTIPDLISFWDFAEPAGQPRVAKGPHAYGLIERAGPVERVADGVFGPHAALVREGQYFDIPRRDCPALNLHGPDAQVTVVAWLKWHHKTNRECEAVAGMWHETGRRRQYCLFLNLSIWNSKDQVCGHVSNVGGPTEGYKYCMDASIGQTQIPFDQWVCCGFTYDARHARSYLNGRLDARDGRNPYPYPGGLFDGGPDGADFTVAAVHRSNTMGNWFTGVLGGLAVYRRALTDAEMASLASNVA
jgi:hypothetical protein